MDGITTIGQLELDRLTTGSSAVLLAIALATFGAALVILALPSGRRYVTHLLRRKPRTAPPSIADRISVASKHAQDQEQLRQLMHDIHEVTRLCAARIDDRAAKLDALIARADAAIERLEHAPDHPSDPADISVRSVRPRRDSRSRRDQPSPPRVETPNRDALADRICELARSGKTPVEIAGELEEQVGKIELILALNN